MMPLKNIGLLSRLKALGLVTAVLSLVFSLQGCSYVIRGAWEEMRILAKRRDVQRLLNEGGLSSDEKSKLALALEVRKYAELRGLKVKRAYSQYSAIDTSSLVWVVTAAPQLEFKPKTWWFPIVGTVPYKGFFDKQAAEDYANGLKSEGFDVSVRSSSAFSTLGYFNDPILSTMLKGDEVTLSDTLFHELLHRTLWISDAVDFNESLANFFGIQLAIEFFRETGRPELEAKAQRRKAEELAFAGFIEEVSKALTDLYASDLIITDKLEQKERLLEQARIKWESRGQSIYYSLAKFPLNNASLLSLRVYLRELTLFEELYLKCGSDLGRVLEELSGAQGGEGSFDELRESLKQGGIC